VEVGANLKLIWVFRLIQLCTFLLWAYLPEEGSEGIYSFIPKARVSRLAESHVDKRRVTERTERQKKQWIFIRGTDQTNPILLFLHGGPGAPLLGMSSSRKYDAELINHFTVVPWDTTLKLETLEVLLAALRVIGFFKML
jgi:hypothetical protein